MDAMVTWKGRMAFEGAGPTGHTVQLDSDVSMGGENNGARPMELIALGLAGCAAMDAISILLKKQQIVKDFQVQFHGDRSQDHPRVFIRSALEYRVYGIGLDETAVRRAIELSVGKYCPVYAMLERAFPIRLFYKIFDAETNSLVKEGEFIPQTTGA